MLRQATLDLSGRWRGKRVWTRASSLCSRFDPKPLLPYALFLLYCAVGSAAFHFIELHSAVEFDMRATNDSAKCRCREGFNASLFYVLSLSSTIGFGTVYACTVGTKTLSIFYSLIGIPLVLMILSDIGSRMCRVVRTVYVPLHMCTFQLYIRAKRWWERRELRPELPHMGRWDKLPYIDEAVLVCDGELDLSLSSSSTESGEESELLERSMVVFEENPETASLESIDEPDIPVSLGVCLTVACILMLSEYYRRVELYSTSESLYYSLLTYVAGDFVPTNFNYAAPVYILIFLGFSMLSLTISIVQNNIENLMKRVRREVQREIIKEMERNADGRDGRHKSPDEIMNEVMKKHGGAAFMQSMVISQKQIDNLQDFADTAARQSNVYVQTDPDPNDKPPPILVSKGTSCAVRVAHKESATLRPNQGDAATNARPQTGELSAQAGPLLLDASACANVLPDQLKASQTFLDVRDSPAQVSPVLADKGTNQSIEYAEQSSLVKPKMRTVAIQFPRLAAPPTAPWRIF